MYIHPNTNPHIYAHNPKQPGESFYKTVVEACLAREFMDGKRPTPEARIRICI